MKKIKIMIWSIDPVVNEIYPTYNSGYNFGSPKIITVTEDELSSIDPETHDYKLV